MLFYMLNMQMSSFYDELYVTEMMKVYDKLSLFSGPRPDKRKCEVAGIVLLKGVKMALYGINNIKLTSDSIKILGILFSFNKQIASKKECVKNIKNENFLKFWRMRNLTSDI